MHPMNRRAFILTGAAAGACFCSGCATISGTGDTPSIPAGAFTFGPDGSVVIDLDKTPQLAAVGGSVKIRSEQVAQSLIVAHTGSEEYVALSIKCTHRGVEVEYQPDTTRFKCASIGGSTYDLKGINLGGPAREPLAHFPVTKSGSTLIITLS